MGLCKQIPIPRQALTGNSLLREQAICEQEQTGGVVRIGWPEWLY